MPHGATKNNPKTFIFDNLRKKKTSNLGKLKLKFPKMYLYTTDIHAIFLIMRSFKTSNVELFQLDPNPGVRLASPMILFTNFRASFLIEWCHRRNENEATTNESIDQESLKKVWDANKQLIDKVI